MQQYISTVTPIFYQATQKPQKLMTVQVCGTTKLTQTFPECQVDNIYTIQKIGILLPNLF